MGGNPTPEELLAAADEIARGSKAGCRVSEDGAVLQHGILMEGRSMKIQYSVQSRKQLADDIASIMNTIPKYLGVPTCNYQIGNCILDRHGLLIIPDDMPA